MDVVVERNAFGRQRELTGDTRIHQLLINRLNTFWRKLDVTA
ncbi:MAG: hypothetical protein QW468_01865 [Candidatus Bathyarchaeia archaeon]